MNKLVETNQDFKKFLQDIKIDFESKRIHQNEYDEILAVPYTYASELLKRK